MVSDHCVDFISKSPFLFISSSDKLGKCDVSPRGDAPGFVYILNESCLIIPERPGNKRADTLLNIASNPHVGLMFMIPGLEEVLRINGKACVTTDQDLLIQMQANGKVPLYGIGIEVEECFLHCAKAMKHSQLWDLKTWADKELLPKASQILAAHSGRKSKEVEDILHESYTKRLY